MINYSSTKNKEGAAAQDSFRQALNQGITPEELHLLEQVLQKIARNIRD